MTRARVFGCLVLFLIATMPVRAISPSWVMFYGGPLRKPIVSPMRPSSATMFLWDTYPTAQSGVRFVAGRLERGPIPPDLDGRPFIHVAVFWGWWPDKPTRPEDASQHGRLYLPTPSAPAAIVLTWSAMEEPGKDRPSARPIPSDLDEHRDVSGIGHAGFVTGRTLSAGELAVVRSLGVPGLQAGDGDKP